MENKNIHNETVYFVFKYINQNMLEFKFMNIALQIVNRLN